MTGVGGTSTKAINKALEEIGRPTDVVRGAGVPSISEPLVGTGVRTGVRRTTKTKQRSPVDRALATATGALIGEEIKTPTITGVLLAPQQARKAPPLTTTSVALRTLEDLAIPSPGFPTPPRGRPGFPLPGLDIPIPTPTLFKEERPRKGKKRKKPTDLFAGIYTPQLEAVLFDIRGKPPKIPKAGLTGLEFRPVPKRRRRKKK
jgi:hypothetical protein